MKGKENRKIKFNKYRNKINKIIKTPQENTSEKV